jgi:hypothetical protein
MLHQKMSYGETAWLVNSLKNERTVLMRKVTKARRGRGPTVSLACKALAELYSSQLAAVDSLLDSYKFILEEKRHALPEVPKVTI